MNIDAQLERAAAGKDAWNELLAAWSEVPAAELADAIAARPLDPALADVIAADASQAETRLVGVDRTRDPRVSAMLVDWVIALPWHATGSQPFYRAVFARIEEIADPRAIDGLARVEVTAIKGASMRSWMTKRIATTRDALRERYPDGVPALPAKLAKLARAAAKHAAEAPAVRKQSSAAANAEQLLAEIRANPHDDAPRQVYADLLAQRGDPHGTFINLQLARRDRMPEGTAMASELALLSKHVRRWIGDLVGAVGSVARWRLRVGPAWVGGDLRFERGFLASAGLWGKAAHIAAAMSSPWLATVEELALETKHLPTILAARWPALRALQTRDPISSELLEAVLAAPWASQLTRFGVRAKFPGMRAHLTRLATLRSLREVDLDFFQLSEEVTAGARPLIEQAMTIPQLQRIQIGDSVFARSKSSWQPVDEHSRAFLASLS